MTNASSEQLAVIGQLKDLQELTLAGETIEGDVVATLAPLQQLGTLDLRGAWVGDDKLASIDRLGRLKTLRVDSNRVTNAGLEHVSGLRELQFVAITSANITDAGVHFLSQIPHLAGLHLDFESTYGNPFVFLPNFDGQRLSDLKDAKELESLTLASIHLDASAFRALRMLPALKTLTLPESDASPEALEELKKFQHLEYLAMQIDGAQEAELQAALPELSIWND